MDVCILCKPTRKIVAPVIAALRQLCADVDSRDKPMMHETFAGLGNPKLSISACQIMVTSFKLQPHGYPGAFVSTGTNK